jgi:hypothetical protein
LVKPSGSDITVIDASRNPVVVLAGVSEVGLQKFERLISDIKPGEQPLAGYGGLDLTSLSPCFVCEDGHCGPPVETGAVALVMTVPRSWTHALRKHAR